MTAQRLQKAPQQSTKAAYQARASGTGGRAQRAARRARHGSPRTQHPRKQQDGVLSVSGPQVVQVDAVHLGLGGGHGGAAREKPRPQRATELARQPAPAPSPALGHPALHFSFPNTARAGQCSTGSGSGPTHGSAGRPADVNRPTAPQLEAGPPGGGGGGEVGGAPAQSLEPLLEALAGPEEPPGPSAAQAVIPRVTPVLGSTG